MFSAPTWSGPESDHFDGKRFHNETLLDPDRPEDVGEAGTWAFLRWRMNRDLAEWPDFVELEPGAHPPERVGAGELRVTFVNHATVLVQMDGLNVLTDPVWSDRVSPVSFTGPRRRHPPGIRFENLPPIDLVLISHNHYDALDVASLTRLAEEHAPVILAGLGNNACLVKEEIGGGEDMDWWDVREMPGSAGPVKIHCVPVRHFSGRGLCDRNGTLWCGFVLESASGSVYFAGDTGWGTHFGAARERLGPMRLALLPAGSYKPEWFMAPVHMGPADALRAHHALGAATSVAIHYGTFPLGDDGPREPIDVLEGLLDATESDTGTRPAFWSLAPGEGRDVPAVRR